MSDAAVPFQTAHTDAEYAEAALLQMGPLPALLEVNREVATAQRGGDAQVDEAELTLLHMGALTASRQTTSEASPLKHDTATLRLESEIDELSAQETLCMLACTSRADSGRVPSDGACSAPSSVSLRCKMHGECVSRALNGSPFEVWVSEQNETMLRVVWRRPGGGAGLDPGWSDAIVDTLRCSAARRSPGGDPTHICLTYRRDVMERFPAKMFRQTALREAFVQSHLLRCDPTGAIQQGWLPCGSHHERFMALGDDCVRLSGVQIVDAIAEDGLRILVMEDTLPVLWTTGFLSPRPHQVKDRLIVPAFDVYCYGASSPSFAIHVELSLPGCKEYLLKAIQPSQFALENAAPRFCTTPVGACKITDKPTHGGFKDESLLHYILAHKSGSQLTRVTHVVHVHNSVHTIKKFPAEHTWRQVYHEGQQANHGKTSEGLTAAHTAVSTLKLNHGQLQDKSTMTDFQRPPQPCARSVPVRSVGRLPSGAGGNPTAQAGASGCGAFGVVASSALTPAQVTTLLDVQVVDLEGGRTTQTDCGARPSNTRKRQRLDESKPSKPSKPSKHRRPILRCFVSDTPITPMTLATPLTPVDCSPPDLDVELPRFYGAGAGWKAPQAPDSRTLYPACVEQQDAARGVQGVRHMCGVAEPVSTERADHTARTLNLAPTLHRSGVSPTSPMDMLADPS